MTKQAQNTEKKVVSINLDKYKKALEGKELKSAKKEKESIYIYPANIPKEKRSDSEGKNFRLSMRKKLKRFSDNIFFYVKSEQMDLLKKEIENFEIFYKENFIVNDFSVKSLTQSKDNEKDVQLMIDIIKDVKSA